MRMPELKSLPRERRLRGYSRMSFFFDHLGLNYSPLCGARRPPINLDDISICGGE